MHGNRFISVILQLWFTAMAALLLPCCNEPMLDNGEEVGPGFSGARAEVTVEFNILDPDALPAVKAYEGDDPLADSRLEKTETERTINHLHLFVFDVQTDGEGNRTETVEEVVKITPAPGDFTSTGLTTGHTFMLCSGKKIFRVGANMTEEHVAAVRSGKALRAGSYEEALAMVMDNYQSKTGGGTDILMFSRPAFDSSDNDEFDIVGSDNLYVKAQLKRLVSKVLVVGNYKGAVVDPDGRSGTINYIKTSEGFFFDFQVILNNTNRALTIAETFSVGSDLFNIDPNWNLSDMVKNGDQIRYEDMFDVAGNFTTWDGDQLKERLESTSDWWCMDVPSNKSEYLGKGLYCLENTVYDDYGNLTSEKKMEAAYLATTHVYIKARFVPITVYGESQAGTINDVPSTPEDEQEIRLSHLYWNKDKNGNNPYTFYVENGSSPKKFYTTTGVTKWAASDYSKFTEYTGGWVYFRTFFEEGGKDDLDNQITYDGIEHWGIRRNDYCILTINSIENWGDTSPGEAFIKVKSETVPWVKAGKSDITVTPE